MACIPPLMPQDSVEVFVRRGDGPRIEIAGVVLDVAEIKGARIKLVAAGPVGTLVIKSRNPKTGNLVLTLAGGQDYCPSP